MYWSGTQIWCSGVFEGHWTMALFGQTESAVAMERGKMGHMRWPLGEILSGKVRDTSVCEILNRSLVWLTRESINCTIQQLTAWSWYRAESCLGPESDAEGATVQRSWIRAFPGPRLNSTAAARGRARGPQTPDCPSTGESWKRKNIPRVVPIK